MTLSASVIIPNLDAPTVDRTVGGVFDQVGARAVEVIVVGRDGPGRLAGDGRVRLVSSRRPLPPGAARNLGMAHATGDVFVFIDADCRPEPDWLAAHLDRHRAGETVVGGAVLWDEDNYWRLADNLSMFHASDAESPEGHRRFLPTLNLSVRRSAVRAAGPMCNELPRGEDVDWTVRLARSGHTPYFEPRARVWHRPARSTMGSMWRHWYESGRWMVGVRQRYPEVFEAPTWLYAPHAALALAPLIAASATFRLYRRGAAGRRYTRTLPAVYATKLAWCLGAANPATIPDGFLRRSSSTTWPGRRIAGASPVRGPEPEQGRERPDG